jgi:hypothetical protein
VLALELLHLRRAIASAALIAHQYAS